METIKNWVQLFRVKHWIKNVIIIMPMFFAKKISFMMLVKCFSALISFCVLASAIYIFNDVQDLEVDKKSKKKRPIANGLISVKHAMFMHYILLIVGLILLGYTHVDNLGFAFFLYIGYYIINVIYSLRAKNVPLLDVVILASGFLIRLFFGTAVTGIAISQWLYLVIMTGSFYLGLCKRRNELLVQKEGRKVLEYYNYSFLDKNMYLCLGLTIVFYALWCADYGEKSRYLLLTLPLVLIIAMKYNLSVEDENSTGDPTDIILADKVMMLLIMLLITMLFVIIYVV